MLKQNFSADFAAGWILSHGTSQNFSIHCKVKGGGVYGEDNNHHQSFRVAAIHERKCY